MERISQALELARRDRERSREALATVVPPLQPPPARPATVTRSPRVHLSPEVLERHRILSGDSDEQTRQAYKMLRTQVMQRMNEHGMQTLAIVSPTRGEGKSLTACNLAISIADGTDRTALLVDFDLHRPAVQQMFGLALEHGFDDYLRGVCSLQQAICRPDEYERLALLPVRAPITGSSELLSGTRVRDLVRELKGRYPDRIVLFDLPPVLATDDALAFSPCVDAALIVACEGRTKRDDLVRTLELLHSTRIVGTVLNRSSEPGAGVY
jgi:Mrp family chromosome partitioning ATPase